MVTAHEEIDFSLWTVEEQTEAYQELVEILNPPTGGCDYPSMTDEQLSASLKACVAEIETRSTSIMQKETEFLGDTILSPVEAS